MGILDAEKQELRRQARRTRPKPPRPGYTTGWGANTPKYYNTPGVGADPTSLSQVKQGSGSVPAYYKGIGFPGQQGPMGQWPSSLGSGSGGGGYGGYGGGGGGVPKIDQATADMLLRLIQQRPQTLTPGVLDLPDYQGTTMPAFDTSMYDQLRGNIDTAAQADRTAAQGAYDNLGASVAQLPNAYANAPQTATPQMQAAYSNLMGQQGNAMVANQIGQENAYSQNSDGAFANLMALLAGNEQASNQSRQAQVGMDANTAQRMIDAQASAGRAGVGVRQGEAQQQYERERRDRAAEDSRAAQDRAMQEVLMNWQAQQDAARYNTEQGNAASQGNLSTLIDLILQMQQAGLTLPAGL